MRSLAEPLVVSGEALLARDERLLVEPVGLLLYEPEVLSLLMLLPVPLLLVPLADPLALGALWVLVLAPGVSFADLLDELPPMLLELPVCA